MGLDIRVYSKMTLVKSDEEVENLPEDERDSLYDEYAHLYDNRFGRGDGLVPGFYSTDDSRTMHFRAGSYSGYNMWRDNLARLIGRSAREMQNGGDLEDIQKLPFFELIYFSDCEGFIGPKTSAKLAKDFTEWEKRAEKFAATLGADDGPWWLERYKNWKAAFMMASEGGAVLFR